MIHKVKHLAVAVCAIFALSAVGASAANAAGVFTWASGTTYLDAVQDTGEGGTQIFTTTPGMVTCNEVNGKAMVSGTEATEVGTETITYRNSGSAETCPGPFGTNPKITMHGCVYRFTAGETIGTTGMEATGIVHILCPGPEKEKEKIVIDIPGCTIEVPEQTPTGGHVIFKTVTNTPTSPDDVTIEATVTGIHYSDSGILCGTHATETNGTYTGNVTVTGTTPSGIQTEVSVH